ncbi:MAG: LPD5 domain-containing protein, partial [Giesbergeria sp.]
MRAVDEQLAAVRALLDKAGQAQPSDAAETPATDSGKPKAEARAAASKVEDFGQKLEGARKDYAAALKDATSLDVAAHPLSKTWPEPDYEKLLASGVDSWTVAFAHAARDSIPTKPQASWKLKGWAKNLAQVRDLTERLLSDDGARGAAQAHLSSSGSMALRNAVELYQDIGHGTSLKGIELHQGDYSVYKGEKFDPPMTMWTVTRKARATAFSNWGTEIANGRTRAEAIGGLKAYLAQQDEKPPAESRVTFAIYSRRRTGEVFVGKKIGKTVAELQGGFKTAAEARKYLAEHQAELEAKLAAYKDIPSERNATNAPRVGIDHRSGGDVTPEQFSDAFGFRGVQFGNHIEGPRRQADLNRAYDALMDLAGVLDLPPRALSLNGELGLAFGARGKGGKNAAAAHYEHGTVVINLTKGSGAGSLAHELFHAIDNYFSRSGGDKTGYMTQRGEGAPNIVRPEMTRAFEGINRAISTTRIRERSKELDK